MSIPPPPPSQSSPPPPPPSGSGQPSPPPPPGYGGQPAGYGAPPDYGAQPAGYGAPPGYGGQPAGYGAPPNLAGFGARLGGYLLDSLLYGLLLAVFVVPAVALGIASVSDCSTTGDDNEIRCDPGEFKGEWLAAGIVIGVIGLIVVTIIYIRALGRTGQTWGRKIAGVKVVDERTGQPLGVGRAFGRQAFAYFISGQICYLGYLWVLWDPKKQTWHDKVVSSVVVSV